jgi:hypothetical protein
MESFTVGRGTPTSTMSILLKFSAEQANNTLYKSGMSERLREDKERDGIRSHKEQRMAPVKVELPRRERERERGTCIGDHQEGGSRDCHLLLLVLCWAM